VVDADRTLQCPGCDPVRDLFSRFIEVAVIGLGTASRLVAAESRHSDVGQSAVRRSSCRATPVPLMCPPSRSGEHAVSCCSLRLKPRRSARAQAPLRPSTKETAGNPHRPRNCPTHSHKHSKSFALYSKLLTDFRLRIPRGAPLSSK
jgi:hypothetical protein